jgi:LemA protein
LVFWSLGAYNRLVRLKAAAQTAGAHWRGLQRRCVQLARDWVAAWPEPALPAPQAPDRAQGVNAEALWAACALLETALSLAEDPRQPPEPRASAPEASAVLQNAWADAMQAAAGADGDVAAWQTRWAELQALLVPAQRDWEEALQAYRCAIRQFPASVLARVVGFRPL